MHKKAEESSIQYSRRVDAAVCVRALQMCAWESSHTALESVFYARLVPSGSPYIESWYARLNENARVGGNA